VQIASVPFRGLEFRVDLTAWVVTFEDLVWDLGNEGEVFDEGGIGKWLRFADSESDAGGTCDRSTLDQQRNRVLPVLRLKGGSDPIECSTSTTRWTFVRIDLHMTRVLVHLEYWKTVAT